MQNITILVIGVTLDSLKLWSLWQTKGLIRSDSCAGISLSEPLGSPQMAFLCMTLRSDDIN